MERDTAEFKIHKRVKHEVYFNLITSLYLANQALQRLFLSNKF